MSRRKNRGNLAFGVCVNNEGYPASLELMKLYRIVSDAEAEAEGMLRIIDESGEGYLYNASRFIVVNVPEEVETAYAQL